jgi:hypothetical protein
VLRYQNKCLIIATVGFIKKSVESLARDKDLECGVVKSENVLFWMLYIWYKTILEGKEGWDKLSSSPHLDELLVDHSLVANPDW